jgi:uncharacterized protein (UPF0548 family)
VLRALLWNSYPASPISADQRRKYEHMTRSGYREVPSLFGPAPAGYRVTERWRVIGSGTEDFARARDAIWQWRIQHGSRYIPVSVSDHVTMGEVSAFRIPFGPLRPLVTCRVFAVFEDAHVAGFAHEAVRGHPQSGWESFLIDQGPEGEITLRIRVVSRPSAWWMRLAGPFAQLALELLLRRNLRSLDSVLRAD